jgi:hypothetical protein
MPDFKCIFCGHKLTRSYKPDQCPSCHRHSGRALEEIPPANNNLTLDLSSGYSPYDSGYPDSSPSSSGSADSPSDCGGSGSDSGGSSGGDSGGGGGGCD